MTVQSEQSLEGEGRALLAGERLNDPYPVWNRLRDEAPVLAAGSVVVLSRYADVKKLVLDRENYSGKLHIVGTRADEIVAGLSPEVAEMWREMAAYEALMMTRTDGAEHDRLRRIA